MTERKIADPTKPELAILKLLWRAKEMNAREIHREIEQEFGWSYSTVRTVLERMAEKGLIEKSPADGVNIYTARVGKITLLSRMIADFSKRDLELSLNQNCSAKKNSKNSKMSSERRRVNNERITGAVFLLPDGVDDLGAYHFHRR